MKGFRVLNKNIAPAGYWWRSFEGERVGDTSRTVNDAAADDGDCDADAAACGVAAGVDMRKGDVEGVFCSTDLKG